MSTSVALPIVGPFATAGFTQTYWSTMVTDWFGGGGVHGDPNSTDLQPFGDSSGMQIKVKIGQCNWLGSFGELDSQATIDIASNGTGNPRIDRVVVRRDATAHTMTLTRIAGTAAGTPVAPALTAQDCPIALVAVAAGAVTITAGNVTDDRLFFPTTNTPVLDVAHLPASPRLGQTVYIKSLNQSQRWNGSAWVVSENDTGWVNAASSLSTGWGDSGGPSNDPVHMQARVLGHTCHLRGTATRTGSGAGGTILNLPAGYWPPFTHRWSTSSADTAGTTQLAISPTTGALYVPTWSSGPAIGSSWPIDTCYPID